MEKGILKVTMDRPIGYVDDFGSRYPINYGYIPGVMGGDGEEQDVYVISKNATQPLQEFKGERIAIITRKDDIETKWVVSSVGERYTIDEIKEKVDFIEKHFNSVIELVHPLEYRPDESD